MRVAEETLVGHLPQSDEPTQQFLDVSEPLEWLFLRFLLAK